MPNIPKMKSKNCYIPIATRHVSLTPAEEKMVEDMRVRMAQKAEEEKEEKWAVFHHPLFDNLVEGSNWGNII